MSKVKGYGCLEVKSGLRHISRECLGKRVQSPSSTFDNGGKDVSDPSKGNGLMLGPMIKVR
jgi:hypothetical protein